MVILGKDVKLPKFSFSLKNQSSEVFYKNVFLKPLQFSQESTGVRVSTQVASCQFFENFKETFCKERLRATTSEMCGKKMLSEIYKLLPLNLWNEYILTKFAKQKLPQNVSYFSQCNSQFFLVGRIWKKIIYGKKPVGGRKDFYSETLKQFRNFLMSLISLLKALTATIVLSVCSFCWSRLTLRKISNFHLIFWCGNCAFPQNIHTRKLGDMLIIYAVLFE